MTTPPSLSTATRRALQPLWNALDDVGAALDAGVVLAVSGGPDSRALLEAWTRWPARASRAAVVVCVDHGRRASAAAEAAAVVALADALGLAAEVRAVRPLDGDEASLRRARHAALHAAAKAHGCRAIALAHHRGDVAEGVLLHLAGLGGGRGGAAPAAVTVNDDGVALVRPFLGLPKATLRMALDGLGIHDVVVDEDDVAGRNARGWLRNRVLAPLAEKRGDLEEALARHARRLREDDDVLDALVPDDDTVDATLAPALLRRWLRRRVARFASDPRSSPRAMDDVVRLAGSGDVGVVALRGCRAEIRRQGGRRTVAVVAASTHDGRGHT